MELFYNENIDDNTIEFQLDGIENNHINKVLRKKEGDIIFLHESHHGFKIIKDCSIIEIKQGPYIKLADKVLFKKVDEKNVRYK